MAGLRERQKAARDRRIIQAASSAFREKGYRSVRIEDLAEIAEVSVGTVYNYYQTKGDILIATVAMEVEEVIASGEEVLSDPPRDVEQALLKLIYQYYDHSLIYLSKEMWRTAMALSIESPNSPSGQRYAAQDRKLMAQVASLITVLQARGDVRAGLDAEHMGRLIFACLNQMFIEFVTDESMTLQQLRDGLLLQIRPLAAMMSEQS